jgi:hypothetical protein
VRPAANPISLRHKTTKMQTTTRWMLLTVQDLKPVSPTPTASNRMTSAPLSCNRRAAAKPAIPAPMTTTRFPPTILPLAPFGMRVHFGVVCTAAFGEHLGVVGSVKELGDWNVDCCLRLQWSEGDLWSGHVDLPESGETLHVHIFAVIFRYLTAFGV